MPKGRSRPLIFTTHSCEPVISCAARHVLLRCNILLLTFRHFTCYTVSCLIRLYRLGLPALRHFALSSLAVSSTDSTHSSFTDQRTLKIDFSARRFSPPSVDDLLTVSKRPRAHHAVDILFPICRYCVCLSGLRGQASHVLSLKL
jgi:hypothetical protein